MGQAILVVGQGLGGSMISFLLYQKGINHLVIDPNENNATKVSSGLVNPITGRRYVKSWMIDQFLSTALEVYHDIEDLLAVSILHRTQIIRGLKNIKEENDWNARIQDVHYQGYMDASNSKLLADKKFISQQSYGKVLKGLRIDLKKFVDHYRIFLEKHNLLIEQVFEHDKLIVGEEGYRYMEHEYKQMVFCEGWKVKDNPYFNKLPVDPAKGEMLIIKVPKLNLQIPYRNQIFLVPLGEDLYWVGSSYEWEVRHDRPTAAKRLEILKKLDAMLDSPYEVVAHQAGVRPTTELRKPIIGQHPKYPGLYLFNGLGTKGASLAPFFGRQLIDLILEGKNVMKEVDLPREYFG